MSRVLTRDEDWAAIQGSLCKVNRFTPFARVERGRLVGAGRATAYGTIAFQTVGKGGILEPETVGVIRHRLDFRNLWSAFVERRLGEGEVVIVVWGKHYLRGFAKAFSAFMPRLIVLIFTDRSLQLLTNPDYEPELKGEARFHAEKWIAEWRPKVLE